MHGQLQVKPPAKDVRLKVFAVTSPLGTAAFGCGSMRRVTFIIIIITVVIIVVINNVLTVFPKPSSSALSQL